MQKRLFQLPLCLLLIFKELRLRASHLPNLKQLFRRDGIQLGLELLARL